MNSEKKAELKKLIKNFSIRFSSSPYNTDVEYDFTNKTKTIIHYTSGTWLHTDEVVEYDKFDELLDYLCDTVFTNTDNWNKVDQYTSICELCNHGYYLDFKDYKCKSN